MCHKTSLLSKNVGGGFMSVGITIEQEYSLDMTSRYTHTPF